MCCKKNSCITEKFTFILKSIVDGIREGLTRERYILISILVFIVLIVGEHLGIFSYMITGLYPFGKPPIVMLPIGLLDWIIYLLVLFSVCILLILIFNGKTVAHRIFGFLLIGILGCLFVFLYFFNIDGHHVSIMDSYELAAGALEIAYYLRYPFMHKVPFGASLAIIPFALSKDEFIIQIGIISYVILLILLSVKLWRKLLFFGEAEKNYFPIFVFLIIINPMIVAISRTISYEPIMLLILSLILTLHVDLLKYETYVNTKKTIKKLTLLALFFVFIIMIRVNYIVVFVLPSFLTCGLYYLSIFLNAIYKQRRLERKAVFYLVYLLVEAVFLYLLARSLIPGWATNSSALGRMFSIRRMLIGILAGLYVVISSINAPPARTLFMYGLFELRKFNILNLILGAIIFVGILKLLIKLLRSNEYRFLAMYLILTMLFNIGFYATYGGWQARYLLPTLYITIFLVAKVIASLVIGTPDLLESKKNSLENFKSKKSIVIYYKALRSAFILMCLIATTNAFIAVFYWNTVPVAFDNSCGILSDDAFSELFQIVKSYSDTKTTILFTSLEALAVFYKYKLGLKIEIFFVYKFFIENTINNKTVEELINAIYTYMFKGYTILYLAGWPEIDGYRPPTSEKSFAYFYATLKQTFNYIILKEGPIRARQSQNLEKQIYELLLLTAKT